jgi:hypothetical protein
MSEMYNLRPSASFPKEVVLWIVIALKNPLTHIQPGSNPQTLGLMVSTLPANHQDSKLFNFNNMTFVFLDILQLVNHPTHSNFTFELGSRQFPEL